MSAYTAEQVMELTQLAFERGIEKGFGLGVRLRSDALQPSDTALDKLEKQYDTGYAKGLAVGHIDGRNQGLAEGRSEGREAGYAERDAEIKAENLNKP